ncbi:MAG: FAD-binding oxidoreductase [Bacteroidetes bacterium]|nr:FAD-binding oxidoreductase [Bacteroidota bacterium]MBU1373753.1 FAD-binding oxidoreductase [Bacteroidota bacterium]MBU1486147.1 FAD-binding oxidoreductase [Bacteroidota bacterium]MBU1761214.1 FAD-binding oxidoreductase [Bacteroidota bacterium]MBU2045332.1 FAD-binding oxidoreductase [Bacteroidota bacterium]
MSYSYWEQQSFFGTYDVIIVGSGIVGLNAALALKSSSPTLKIAILERGILPSGASTKNAGFACFGSVSELMSDIKTYGENTVYELVERRFKGLETLRKTLGDEAISFEQNGGYELFLNTDKKKKNVALEAIPYLNNLLKPVFSGADIFTDASDKIAGFGFSKVDSLIFNQFEGQIDTGKMMSALIQKVQSLGVKIFNQCEVFSFEEVNIIKLNTNIGEFKTHKILFATNAFAPQLLPNLDIKPGRGQVLITAPIVDLKFTGTFHYDEGYYYFRNIDDRILLGGGRNLNFKAEETYELDTTEEIQNKLKELLSEIIYPNKAIVIDYNWSGIMGFGETLEPIVEKITEGIFVAARCNGMGIALGSLTGKDAANLVLKDI